MKTQTTQSEEVARSGRLDAWYYLSPASAALNAIVVARHDGVRMQRLGDPEGLAEITKPNRSKLALAAPSEPSVAYIRPYDVFQYLPEPVELLSIARSVNLDSFRLEPGTILQTCSGRNLGPSALVDRYLARFIVGGDMIRLRISNERIRHYVYGYLNSQFGQSLLRRHKTGSVIDHLDPDDLGRIEVPELPSKVIDQVADSIKAATRLRETARLKLHELIGAYENALPQSQRSRHLAAGWIVGSTSLVGRLDAAFYDPEIVATRNALSEMGGKPLREFATVKKPGGRYKTNYVDAQYGRPLLSGTQLLQAYPIHLQYIATDVFSDVRQYELHRGWIAYQADGRVEDDLGTPALIAEDRDRWLASGHIGRVQPKPGVDAGWLYLALKTRHTQAQLKARASGSVVDSTFENDMEEVILPPPLNMDGQAARKAWDDFAAANRLQAEACGLVDTLMNDQIKKATTDRVATLGAR